MEGREIGFLYALEADEAALIAAGAMPQRTLTRDGVRIRILTLGEHRIYAVRMGSGPVETSRSVSTLLALYPCDFVLSLGPVGALGEGIEVDSWVRVTRVIPFQMGSMGEDGFSLREARTGTFRSLAAEEEWLPERWKGLPTVTAASGEVFVASDFYRREVATLASAEVIEMNLAGLVPSLQAAKVESMHFRVVSDWADAKAGEDFAQFVTRYDGSGGRMAAELFRQLPLDATSPASYEGLRALLEPERSAHQGESEGSPQAEAEPKL